MDIDLQTLEGQVVSRYERLAESVEGYRTDMLAAIKEARENILLKSIERVNARLDAIEKMLDEGPAD